MSTAELNAGTPDLAEPPPAGPALGGRRPRRVALVLLACLILAGSGALRLVQARRVERAMDSGKVAPFPLKTLPTRFGPWVELADAPRMDPEVTKATGCTDSVFRTYENRQTGTRLVVIVLYGPAASVRIHAPELCYPVSGYTQVGPTRSRAFDIVRPGGGEVPARFSSLHYVKGQGGTAARHQVYYAWRYNDRWTPEALNPKAFQRIPGMYKVHIDRVTAENELIGEGDPCESFLRELVPELERRMADAARARSGAGAGAGPSGSPG